MPTFTSAAVAQTGLVPVRLNEVNLRITPIRITPTAAEPWRTGLSAAFFDEAATGTEADQATTALRAGVQALIVQSDTGVPLQAYFPSGPSALTKEIDGRTRKHTGTYVLRTAKAYARNLINLVAPYAAVTGDDVGIADPNMVVRVPTDANAFSGRRCVCMMRCGRVFVCVCSQ